ncbi:hypothetical protein WJX73_001141 [Symbiochloris irregularis]|uniref:Glycosyltransferase 2-like domain-containing protein n=1 Tax=Symbiochloris irregularis TaxID=706552 RepID=A0AAW1PCH3_9CHLO
MRCRYKEPWALYSKTLSAALDIVYPPDKLHIYVLDDGRDSPVKHEIEEEFGMRESNCASITYLQRPDGTHAKAGNLNYGLQRSSGSLIAVLDADHIATKDFLTACIPHLLQPNPATGAWSFGKCALIQTKQHFYNAHKVLVQLSDGRNDFFNSLSMLGYSGASAGLCCGTGYICQRSALESIGETSGLFVYMLLPRLTLKQKVAGMIGMLSLVPVYLSTLRLWTQGHLRPGKGFKHFRSSAEVAGDTSFPPLAYLSLVLSLLILAPVMAACIWSRHLLLSPEDIGSIMMAVWFALMVSLVRALYSICP